MAKSSRYVQPIIITRAVFELSEVELSEFHCTLMEHPVLKSFAIWHEIAILKCMVSLI